MSTKIFKYDVPVDDKWHEIEMPFSNDPVLYVACQNNVESVQFWVEVLILDEKSWPVASLRRFPRTFRVFGTGHEIPVNALHRGSVLIKPSDVDGGLVWGGLVWHLYEHTKTRLEALDDQFRAQVHA